MLERATIYLAQRVDVDDGSVEHRDNPLEGIELARTPQTPRNPP